MKILRKISYLASIALILLTFYSCIKREIEKHGNYNASIASATITLEEAFDMIGQKAGIKIKSNSSNFENTNTSLTTNAITCPSYPYTASRQNDIKVTSYSKNEAPYTGAGVAVPYKFTQGSTYVIEIMIGNVAYGTEGRTHASQDRNPSMQVGLANTQNFPAECNGSINLALLGIPFTNLGKLPIQKYPFTSADFTTTYTTKVMTLTATECFNYLWINFMPPDGGYKNEHHISYIKITRSGQNFSIEGPSDITSGNFVYKVKSNSFLLDHPFVWRTTGNIAIVGDSIGASLTVKKSNTSPLQGTISALLAGCGEIALKKFNACETQNSFATINGPEIIKIGQQNRTYSWNLTDNRYTNLNWNMSSSYISVNSSTPNTLLISVPRTYQILDPSNGGDFVTLTLSAQGPCGIGYIYFPIFISNGNPPINPQQ